MSVDIKFKDSGLVIFNNEVIGLILGYGLPDGEIVEKTSTVHCKLTNLAMNPNTTCEDMSFELAKQNAILYNMIRGIYGVEFVNSLLLDIFAGGNKAACADTNEKEQLDKSHGEWNEIKESTLIPLNMSCKQQKDALIQIKNTLETLIEDMTSLILKLEKCNSIDYKGIANNEKLMNDAYIIFEKISNNIYKVVKSKHSDMEDGTYATKGVIDYYLKSKTPTFVIFTTDCTNYVTNL